MENPKASMRVVVQSILSEWDILKFLGFGGYSSDSSTGKKKGSVRGGGLSLKEKG